MKRYKEHLIQDHIPFNDDLETAKLVQFKMFGISADKFQSTVVMETVITYMKQAQETIGNRLWRPREDRVMPQ